MNSQWQCACSLLFAITFILICASAQSQKAVCGNQNIIFVGGYYQLRIPEHDGPRECVYNFTSGFGTIMDFQFYFVSIGTEHEKCGNDYITVGDTEIELPHPRYTACGKKPPTWEFYSTGNKATVKLLITSELKSVTVRAEVFEMFLNRTQPKCGNRFIRVGTEGSEFSFPPNKITLNGSTRCFYTLLGKNSGNGKMTFSFESINISNKDNCSSDYLQILDEGRKQILPKYCGNKIPSKNISADGNALTIIVEFATEPWNGSVRGYVHHETLKPDGTTSTTSPTEASQTTKTLKPDGTTSTTSPTEASQTTRAGNSGAIGSISGLVITFSLIITTWNH